MLKYYDNLKSAKHPLKIYDKLIGKGAAVLIANLNVEWIYAKTITEEALAILETKCVVTYGRVVENILNRDRSDLCPIEKIAKNCTDVETLYINLREFYIERGFLND